MTPIANALPREVWRGPGSIEPLRMVLVHAPEIMASHRYERGAFIGDTPFLLARLVLERADIQCDATGQAVWRPVPYSEADLTPELMKAIWELLPKLCLACEDRGYLGAPSQFTRRACLACERGEQYRRDGSRVVGFAP